MVENEIRRGLMLVVISVAPEVGFIVPEVASAAKAETAQAVQRAKARAKISVPEYSPANSGSAALMCRFFVCSGALVSKLVTTSFVPGVLPSIV